MPPISAIAQELAQAGPCVVVSINYRLGVLGFYTDPDIGITGNFAIKDQQLALRWVQDNAAALGGDPTRVTIFGQSAGGASILTHLLAPTSWPMFHQAIMQSAPVQCLRHHFRPFPARFSASPHPTRAVGRALLGAQAYPMLIGACNPMLCPIWGYRSRCRC